MPNDTVRIKIDGDVTVQDFRTVLDAFVDLMNTLTAEENPSVTLEWKITNLSHGSALMACDPIWAVEEQRRTAESVMLKYDRLASDAEAGALDGYSDPVIGMIGRITSVVNGRIPRIVMGSGDHADHAITKKFTVAEPDASQANAIQISGFSRTSVRGKIVTLDKKHGLYFTLRTQGDVLVRCYPEMRYRDKLAKYWNEDVWLVVEGLLNRSSQPPTMTEIRDVVSLKKAAAGEWRKAVGCAPRLPSDKTCSSDAVRKIRDA